MGAPVAAGVADRKTPAARQYSPHSQDTAPEGWKGRTPSGANGGIRASRLASRQYQSVGAREEGSACAARRGGPWQRWAPPPQRRCSQAARPPRAATAAHAPAVKRRPRPPPGAHLFRMHCWGICRTPGRVIHVVESPRKLNCPRPWRPRVPRWPTQAEGYGRVTATACLPNRPGRRRCVEREAPCCPRRRGHQAVAFVVNWPIR